MLANNPRPDILDFMSSPFFLSILGDELPMRFCFELLKMIGANKLKKYSNMEKLLKKVADSRLIVYSSGERLKPCEVVDPADELLVSILLKKPDTISNESKSAGVKHEQESQLICPFPPQDYIDDKDVMDALRSLGCVTLSKFESFLRVAKIVAAENNIDGGKFFYANLFWKNSVTWDGVYHNGINFILSNLYPLMYLINHIFLFIAMQVSQQYLEDQRHPYLEILIDVLQNGRKRMCEKVANLQIGDTNLQGK